ncbi:putative tubby-related protein 4 isoform X4 [Apostichopus japonicus]|uniref:Putative tubby-related protein 4 isoform X4 n=1 Tax=Stichopus japonicus TaxID=307972 RepID=A0A2G8JZU5_STIJA|nr:putative tubby-related protein 4 isoform X4 [Apostichopus japonicus]PIK41268.1 putative tubby-related protein 4 isoform X4 [Apostichopus japonicus]
MEQGEKLVKEKGQNGHDSRLDREITKSSETDSCQKDELVNEPAMKQISGRERSLSSSCVPEIKLRVRGQERASIHDISEKTNGNVNDKNVPKRTVSSTKRKNFQRSKSASYAENASSQGAQTKIVTDSTESEDEDGENLEDDHWGSSSARTRKAKLVKQYAECKSRVFVMHNKAPLWNENTQVYQLDFGGRVTQESAKNFQVELQGKQVMQFGRIDGQAYTLDFQYPFSAVQAFAVALANVTQRLK